MSSSFNPYLAWLDVDMGSNAPNLYELLGLKTANASRQEIHDAANQQLLKLKQVNPGDRSALLAQLIREVEYAQKTLTDQRQRALYDQALSEIPLLDSDLTHDLIPPKTPTNAGNRPKSPNVDSRLLSDPRPQSFDQTDLSPPSKTNPKTEKETDQDPPNPSTSAYQTSGVEDESTVTPTKPALPKLKLRAIPHAPNLKGNPGSESTNQSDLAAPLSETTPPIAKPAAHTDTTNVPRAKVVSNPPGPHDEIPVAKAASVYDHQNSDSQSISDATPPIVDVEPPGPPRSGLLYVLAGIFSLLLVAAAFYVMQLIQNANVDSGTLSGPTDRTETILPDDQPKEHPPNEEVQNDNSSTDSQTENHDPNRTDTTDNDLSENSSTAEATTNSENETDAPNLDVTPTDVASNVDLFVGLSQMDLMSQRRLKLQLLDIKNLWRQQEFEAFPYSVHLDARNDTDLKYLKMVNQSVEETTRQLSAFWTQFRLSSQTNVAGDLEVDNRFVAFVEANESQVVLKIAGTVRRYEYPFVPPALMMAIIDQGAIKDIPTYRLQKASYLTSRLYVRPDFLDDITELLTQSEQDGHNVQNQRRLAEMRYWELAVPLFTPAYRETSNPLSVSPSTRQFVSMDEVPVKSAAGLARMVLEDFVSPKSDSLDQLSDEQIQQRYVVALDSARQLAIRGGDTMLAMDLVDEIQWNAMEVPEALSLETLLAVSQSAQTDLRQSKWYCQSVLDYLRSGSVPDSIAARTRLCNAALSVARRHRLRTFEIQLQSKLESIQSE